MAIPPTNLFSNTIDPQGVLELVLEAHPDATVEKDPETGQWSSIEIQSKRGLFKKGASLVINHDPGYYAGDGWTRQRDGMLGHFNQFPMEDLQRARVMATVAAFRFALSCTLDPPVWPDEDDFRNHLIGDIATRLEACVFIPGALLDADYRTLANADGEYDPEAQFPDHAMRIKAEVQVPESGAGSDDEGIHELDPPPPERVAARAMILGSIAVRGLMESDAARLPVEKTAEIEAARQQRIVAWLSEVGLDNEIEPAEREILETPIGQLSERQHLDSIWRFEGLVILAWALRLHDLPTYDQVVETGSLIKALGILSEDQSIAEGILENPNLRPPDHLDKIGEQIFAFHWRLREFSLRPVAMDFRDFAKTSWFGPLDLSWARFSGDDLDLGGAAISAATPDTLSSCSSIANERHLAINWLRGESEIYSEIDTAT